MVRDPETHAEVISGIVSFAETFGWRVVRIDFSPITGPEGNIEFLAEIRKRTDDSPVIPEEEIRRVVDAAHRTMKGQS